MNPLLSMACRITRKFLFSTSYSSEMRVNLLVYMLPLMVLGGCSHQDGKTSPIPRPVKMFHVEDQAEESAMSFAGEVKARYESILSFRVPGKIIERRVEVGDRVRKGQLLASVDPTDYRLATQNLKAQLASAQADRDFAHDDLIRYRELFEQQVISAPDLDRHETAHTTAKERAKALEAQLEQTVNQLDYTHLHADRDGAITALEVEAGQVVSVGQTVVKLAQLNEKEVHIDVPEHRLGMIHPNQEVTVTLWADGGYKIKGHIREIASTANPASRTFRVKATLSEHQGSAQLGMTATVGISSKGRVQIAIPLSAVFSSQSEPGQPRVWLLNRKTTTVESKPVQLGEMVGNDRIVVSGLAEGQLIVSAGVQRLVEGQTIRLPDGMARSSEITKNGV